MEIKDHVIIDGNAVYEIDEGCQKQKKPQGLKTKSVTPKTTPKATQIHHDEDFFPFVMLCLMVFGLGDGNP